MGEVVLTMAEWNAVCRAAGQGHTESACDDLKIAVESILADRLNPTLALPAANQESGA